MSIHLSSLKSNNTIKIEILIKTFYNSYFSKDYYKTCHLIFFEREFYYLEPMILLRLTYDMTHMSRDQIWKPMNFE